MASLAVASSDDAANQFSYVMIPCDLTKPMCVLKHRKNTTLEDDDLRDALKMRFAANAIAEAQMQEYVAGLKDKVAEQQAGDIPSIFDDKMLRQLANSSSVDTFALTVPSKADPLAVSLYVDEKGQAKQLPPNPRASGLAAACGAQLQQFRGDVYLSRYFDDDEAWTRQDFGIADCSSDAPWVASAAAAAKRRGGKGGLASMSSMYDKMGTGKAPVTFDAVQADADAMDAAHDAGAYAWSQTASDVEVRVSVPAATANKDVAVKITRLTLNVGLKGSAPIVDIKRLCEPVDPDGSAWTFDGIGDDRAIVVTLEKAKRGGAWLQIEAD